MWRSREDCLPGMPGNGRLALQVLFWPWKEGALMVFKKKGAPAPAKPKKASAPANAWGDPYYKEVELSLTDALGTKVRVKPSPSGGVLELEFYDKEQLRALAEKLTEE